MATSKFRTIIDSVLIPLILYVAMSCIAVLIYSLGYELLPQDLADKINILFLQGVANLMLVCILVPYYNAFKKKYNVLTKEASLKKSLYIIPLAFSLCIICNIFLQYVPGTIDNEVTKEVYELMESFNVWLVLLIISVLAPIVEEYIFRGFMYEGLASIFGVVPAIICSSLLFGIIHFNLSQGLYGFFAGIFLAYVKYSYKSLKYTIIMHFLMNLSSIIFLPAILTMTSLQERMFAVFISAAILLISLYRIQMLTKEENIANDNQDI